jgi:hypothetical protein
MKLHHAFHSVSIARQCDGGEVTLVGTLASCRDLAIEPISIHIPPIDASSSWLMGPFYSAD